MSSLMNDIRFQKRWGLVIAHQIERSGDVQNYDIFSKIWLSLSFRFLQEECGEVIT